MTERRVLEVAVARLRPSIVRVVGHPHDLERRHEPHTLGRTCRPFGLRELVETLPGDGLLG